MKYTLDRENGLTQRERAVLAGLLVGKSQLQIGADLGVSRQRVHQIVGGLKKKGVVRYVGGAWKETR